MQLTQPSAANNSHRALSEYRAKKLLADYGIPITDEVLVQSREEAVAAAGKIGFPVALKACSPELMHKSEAGCIELNLTTEDDAARAYDRILSVVSGAVSGDLEGMLVAEMVSGTRELVLGLTREPQFGPCVMLGLGGVMTEIFNDTVFRVAPFGRVEAEDMISELKSGAMFNAFRGEGPADVDTICNCLQLLGKIGLDNPGISEIDINPLKIMPDGTVKAVDALVVLSGDAGGRYEEIN